MNSKAKEYSMFGDPPPNVGGWLDLGPKQQRHIIKMERIAVAEVDKRVQEEKGVRLQAGLR